MATSIEPKRSALTWFIIKLTRDKCGSYQFLDFKKFDAKKVGIIKYISLIKSEKYID